MQPTASRVEIKPANLRDATYIGANLRAADREEIFCQVPGGLSGSDVTQTLFGGMLDEWTWIAYLDGQPTTIFGVSPITVSTWAGFAFGTRHLPRTIPRVSAHMLALEPSLIAHGVRRLEVRTIATHDISHQWLRKLGCWFEAELPEYGKDGELFELWCWHIGRPPSQYAKWKPRHVLRTQAAETASATASGGAQER
jgi:hypothetical protein